LVNLPIEQYDFGPFHLLRGALLADFRQASSNINFMAKKAGIVLLNYNGSEDTLACVASLENINYDNYEIIVVDNASTDGSFEKLKKELGNKHTLLDSKRNGGFAYGNNIGIKHGLNNGAAYILLLNNDTVVEPDFLLKLIETAENNETAGIITGKILYESQRDKIWYGGGEINWKRFHGVHYTNNSKDNFSNQDSATAITFASGCLMLIKREVFEKLGLLPEEYFMYYEDVDFCAKVCDRGYSVMYNPQCVIYHKINSAMGEEASAFKVEWDTRSRLIFMRKHKGKFGMDVYVKAIIYFYVTRLYIMAKCMRAKRFDKIKALIKGLF
jgi:GT2 family glycosyltransferase